MESTNNNHHHQLFVSELKELRNEISAVKKRIVQLEESHEKQQEKINILETENHTLKTQLNISGIKEGESVLKRKRTDKHPEKDIESEPSVSVSALASSDKKKVKTNNEKEDDDEAVVLSLCDNGNSFDSLSDDLLHKIVEFNGTSYSQFGSINKRCKNIYDVKEYKLEKKTCVYGHGTLDMILQYYLKERREGSLGEEVTFTITSAAVVIYNRLDVIDWIIQLEDSTFLELVCRSAIFYEKNNILTRVFLKSNLKMLDHLLDDDYLCLKAVELHTLESLKWVRKYGAKWDEYTFATARQNGFDEIVQFYVMKVVQDILMTTQMNLQIVIKLALMMKTKMVITEMFFRILLLYYDL